VMNLPNGTVEPDRPAAREPDGVVTNDTFTPQSSLRDRMNSGLINPPTPMRRHPP
jgi:hypothetical protein